MRVSYVTEQTVLSPSHVLERCKQRLERYAY
jgi:hypothetical protein